MIFEQKEKLFRLLFLFLMVLLCANLTAAQNKTESNNSSKPSVSKVEPPNWWANHSISTVRLLVRGENFQNAKVVSKDKQLKVSNIKVNSRGDYLFFDVEIAKNAKIGKYEFDVSTDKGNTKVPFEISAPVKKDNQTITNDDVIYLIMTDRFADGDTSNNVNVDRSNPRMWHGGDFKGITQKIPYLKELGITAIWLTPWYDNSDEVTTCDKPWCPMASYHGYGSIDHYGVENHFGNFADLREMIEAAHKNGIKVVQDQVFNHVGFKHPWMKNPPLEDWFTPFEQTRFNNSALLSPNSPKSEIDNTLKGWFDFSLPDMNYDQPEVARYELQNALWWIGVTGIDGIRQDTIQYVPRTFIRDWSEAIQKQYPNFYMVGEVFERDSIHTAFFQGGKTGWDNIDTKLPSVFDFKLWETSEEVFTGKKPVRALRDVLKYDGFYGNINRVTTLQNNHDTDRFMSLQGATLEGAMLHTAFLLSTRGIPQLYYGEELAMTGGHDPDNRKDFSGGFAGDKADKFTKEGRTADEQKMFEWTQDWIKLRRENVALREGKTVDLFYDNDAYIFARINTSPEGMLANIIGFNNSEKERVIEIPKNGIQNFLGFLMSDELTSETGKSSNLKAIDGKWKIIVPAKSGVIYKTNKRVLKTGL